MKSKLRKAKTHQAKAKNGRHVYVPVLRALLCACTAISLFGCDEPLQTPISPPGTVSVGSLMGDAMRIIGEGLADADPQIRANAIEVVATTRQLRLMPKVQRLLSDESTPVRFLAILAVGDLRYSLAQQQVVQLLKDENENIRIAAAYAMTKLGLPEYSTVFRDAIASEDQTVRANAALLLGKTGDKNALRYLYWTLQRKDSQDKARFNAVEAIARLGDERIYPKLWTMLISAYHDDRVFGITAMGALGTKKAEDTLITMLDDSVVEVRLAAAEQLGKLKNPIGEPEVLEVFTENLTAGLDQQGLSRVKVLTALAIGQIGTDSLTKFLPLLLQDESRFVRIAAAKAVFECAASK